SEALESVGFSPEALEKVEGIFLNAVHERVQAEPFREELGELLDDYGMIIPEPTNTEEELQEYIDQLECLNSVVEDYNNDLKDELINYPIKEDPDKKFQGRKVRLSTIEEDMLLPQNDEDYFQEENRADARMKPYLDYIRRTMPKE